MGESKIKKLGIALLLTCGLSAPQFSPASDLSSYQAEDPNWGLAEDIAFKKYEVYDHEKAPLQLFTEREPEDFHFSMLQSRHLQNKECFYVLVFQKHELSLGCDKNLAADALEDYEALVESALHQGLKVFVNREAFGSGEAFDGSRSRAFVLSPNLNAASLGKLKALGLSEKEIASKIRHFEFQGYVMPALWFYRSLTEVEHWKKVADLAEKISDGISDDDITDDKIEGLKTAGFKKMIAHKFASEVYLSPEFRVFAGWVLDQGLPYLDAIKVVEKVWDFDFSYITYGVHEFPKKLWEEQLFGLRAWEPMALAGQSRQVIASLMKDFKIIGKAKYEDFSVFIEEVKGPRESHNAYRDSEAFLKSL